MVRLEALYIALWKPDLKEQKDVGVLRKMVSHRAINEHHANFLQGNAFSSFQFVAFSLIALDNYDLINIK